MNLTEEEARLGVTWFESMLHNNPKFLRQKDYQLARKLYVIGGLGVPFLIHDKAENNAADKE